MFCVVYEFLILPGTADDFCAAWSKTTEGIHQCCGSLGSRLHRTADPTRFVAYAQWPDRATWERDCALVDPAHLAARARMKECLRQVTVLEELEVAADLSRDTPFRG